MPIFLDLLSSYVSVDTWIVHIERALGESREFYEVPEFWGKKFSHTGLVALYQGLFQTIDGTLTGYVDGNEVIRFQAIDSTFWEITSTDEELLEYFEKKFGAYRGFAA